MQDANGLFHPDPVIILNGVKSIETGLKWTKLDGSPLNYTGEFQNAGGDIDYGFTAFSEDQIHGVLRNSQQNLICITTPMKKR